jgi:hypothetical protein
MYSSFNQHGGDGLIPLETCKRMLRYKLKILQDLCDTTRRESWGSVDILVAQVEAEDAVFSQFGYEEEDLAASTQQYLDDPDIKFYLYKVRDFTD